MTTPTGSTPGRPAVPDVEEAVSAARVVASLLPAEDDRDWAGVRALLADDVFVDYSALSGTPAQTYTADALAARWQQGLQGLSATQHLMGWPTTVVDGDTATVTADLQITHVLPNTIGDPHWTIGGRYRWRLTRSGSSWLLAETSMTLRWATGNRQLMVLARGDAPE